MEICIYSVPVLPLHHNNVMLYWDPRLTPCWSFHFANNTQITHKYILLDQAAASTILILWCQRCPWRQHWRTTHHNNIFLQLFFLKLWSNTKVQTRKVMMDMVLFLFSWHHCLVISCVKKRQDHIKTYNGNSSG